VSKRKESAEPEKAGSGSGGRLTTKHTKAVLDAARTQRYSHALVRAWRVTATRIRHARLASGS
jgi:hypothetical protein